jgi:hypothetical protein
VPPAGSQVVHQRCPRPPAHHEPPHPMTGTHPCAGHAAGAAAALLLLLLLLPLLLLRAAAAAWVPSCACGAAPAGALQAP